MFYKPNSYGLSKMTLFCVILLCIGTRVVLATSEKLSSTEEVIASSPLIKLLLERVEMLETLSTKQAKEIQTLKDEMSQQRGYVKRLRYKLYTKDSLIRILLKKVGMSANGKTLSSNGIELDDSETAPVFKETRQTKQIRRTVKRIQPMESMHVAFSVSLGHLFVISKNHTNIVFGNIMTNAGNAYHPRNGEFIAPVAGLYVFSTSLVNSMNENIFAYFTVNDKHKSKLYLNGAFDMTSQTVVFALSQGDRVAIQGHPGDLYYGFNPPTYSTFSGFLLQQTLSSIHSNPVIG